MGLGWVWVPAMWVQVPSRVLARFESHPHGFEAQTGFWPSSSPSTWVQIPICGKWLQFHNNWKYKLFFAYSSLHLCKEIQPVHPRGNPSWIFIRCTDAEAETLILGPPDAKNWLIWKDPDAGKHWRWEEKGMTEDEIDGWHHWLNGHEFE